MLVVPNQLVWMSPIQALPRYLPSRYIFRVLRPIFDEAIWGRNRVARMNIKSSPATTYRHLRRGVGRSVRAMGLGKAICGSIAGILTRAGTAGDGRNRSTKGAKFYPLRAQRTPRGKMR